MTYQDRIRGYMFYIRHQKMMDCTTRAMEDIVLALKGLGAHVVPEYEFLRAHHNKVYMEILRKRMMDEDDRLLCLTFGSLEEFKASDIPDQQYVVKKASGAGSKGVALARDRAELTKLVEKFSRLISGIYGK